MNNKVVDLTTKRRASANPDAEPWPYWGFVIKLGVVLALGIAAIRYAQPLSAFLQNILH